MHQQPQTFTHPTGPWGLFSTVGSTSPVWNRVSNNPPLLFPQTWSLQSNTSGNKLGSSELWAHLSEHREYSEELFTGGWQWKDWWLPQGKTHMKIYCSLQSPFEKVFLAYFCIFRSDVQRSPIGMQNMHLYFEKIHVVCKREYYLTEYSTHF